MQVNNSVAVTLKHHQHLIQEPLIIHIQLETKSKKSDLVAEEIKDVDGAVESTDGDHPLRHCNTRRRVVG
uniref:Uncharacterized protein MANES_11G154100 n=1 Tax=Rhizophora mucronata TaxID=61149 RepID=A0A2P2MIV5_RHIMU